MNTSNDLFAEFDREPMTYEELMEETKDRPSGKLENHQEIFDGLGLLS